MVRYGVSYCLQNPHLQRSPLVKLSRLHLRGLKAEASMHSRTLYANEHPEVLRSPRGSSVFAVRAFFVACDFEERLEDSLLLLLRVLAHYIQLLIN